MEKFNFEPREVKRRCRCGVVFVRRSASHKYCCEKCRDEAYTKESEMKKAARREQKERRAKELMQEAKQQVVRALEVAQPAMATNQCKPKNRPYKKRVYSNNTPTKRVDPKAGNRPCGNCGKIFYSVDRTRNQRCTTCQTMANNASGVREFRVGR